MPPVPEGFKFIEQYYDPNTDYYGYALFDQANGTVVIVNRGNATLKDGASDAVIAQGGVPDGAQS